MTAYLGSSPIVAAYAGSTPATAIYAGSSLVWSPPSSGITIGTLAPASPPMVTGAGNSQAHSYAVTTTAATDVVAVFVGAFNSAVGTNGAAVCTWDGATVPTLDLYAQPSGSIATSYLQAFLITSPGAAGSHALVVTLPAAGGSITRDLITVAVPLEGVDMGALPTAFVEASGTTGLNPSLSVPTTAGNLILSTGATYDAGQSAHSGTVLAQSDTVDNHSFGAWHLMATVADTTPEIVAWSQPSSDDWVVVALNFKPG